MVSVCLSSDALLQHLPSYLGFSYLERGVSLHGGSSKVQLLLFTLDEGYLLTTAPPDLERGIAPLGPPAPAQPLLLGHGVATPGRRPSLPRWGGSSWPPPPAWLHELAPPGRYSCLGCGVAPLGHVCVPSQPPTLQEEIRIAKRDKKAFLSDQCKEIEENNRMGKTRDVFKKIRGTKGTFHARWAP